MCVCVCVVRIPTGASDFSPLRNVQTGSGAHPATCLVRVRVLFREVKWPGREAKHLLPSSAEVIISGTVHLLEKGNIYVR